MRLSYSYEDTGSHLHQLNAVAWACWVTVVVVASLALEHPLALAILLGASPIAAAAARVTRQWWSVMRFAVWMFLLVVVINAVVSNEGNHVLWAAGVRIPLIGEPRLTVEALAFGAAMGMRLVTVVSVFALLNLCVHPDELMQAAIKARLPYRSVLVTALATRFIPVLLADAGTIMDVQRSRGVDFSSGGLFQRVRSYGSLVLPLLSNSLDRAVQVAEAMESRGFGASARRTFFRDRPFRRGDALAVVSLCMALVLIVVMKAGGIDAFPYYPTVSYAPLSWSLFLSLAMLLALVLSPILLSRLNGASDAD